MVGLACRGGLVPAYSSAWCGHRSFIPTRDGGRTTQGKGASYSTYCVRIVAVEYERVQVLKGGLTVWTCGIHTHLRVVSSLFESRLWNCGTHTHYLVTLWGKNNCTLSRALMMQNNRGTSDSSWNILLERWNHSSAKSRSGIQETRRTDSK